MDFKNIFRRTEFWLVVVFLVVLAVRLMIVFQTPNFNYDSYFTLREVEHIKQTGLPLYDDPLSYGGKTHLFAPFYFYVLAFFSLIFSVEFVAKVVPNILASLLIILVFYISLKLTKSKNISLLAAFMAGFIPIVFFDINNASINYLAVLLIFGIIYCIFRLNERKYVDYALILMFLLVLTSLTAFVLILGLLFYFILLKTENLEIEMKEIEIILFFTFLVFWLNLLIYKKAFLQHGVLVIWQNIPVNMLSNLFSHLTFIESFFAISIIPLLLGLYAIYSALYLQKNKNILLLTGFTLATFVLLWFKLIALVTGLIFLSITLVILTAYSLRRISLFIEKTKFNRQKTLFLIILLVLFVATSILPSVFIGVKRTHVVPSQDDVNVLIWASKSTLENSTIASSFEEGDLVAYYSKRKNIMDNDFLLVKNIDKRSADLDEIYVSKFETEAITNLNNFKASYIFFSNFSAQKYKIKELSYANDVQCFLLLNQSNDAKLYFLMCDIVNKQMIKKDVMINLKGEN